MSRPSSETPATMALVWLNPMTGSKGGQRVSADERPELPGGRGDPVAGGPHLNREDLGGIDERCGVRPELGEDEVEQQRLRACPGRCGSLVSGAR